jgi:hypothetical protein
MREGLFQRPLYWLSRFGVWLGLKLKYRLRVEGREHSRAKAGGDRGEPLQLSGSAGDGGGGAQPHRAFHGARHAVFQRHRALVFPRVGVIALDRTKGDLGALKKAIATLKEGKVIGLFPEGTRSPDGQMREAKGGIGFLIAKGDVPVVPLHISGTFAAFPKGADKLRPSAHRGALRPAHHARGIPRGDAGKGRLRSRRRARHGSHPRLGRGRRDRELT